MLVMVNGQLDSSISSADRGLLYGHGLFETMRLWDNRIPLLKRHQKRLSEGLDRLSIPHPERLFQQVDTFLKHLSRENLNQGIVKLIVTAGQGGRGYGSPSNLKPTVILQYHSYEASLVAPMNVGESRHVLAQQPVLAGLKHLNRLEQVLVADELSQRVEDDLWLSTADDHVIESSKGNLFFYGKGQWVTPFLQSAGVAGVMRQLLIDEIIPTEGLMVAESTIKRHNLASYTAAFVCNAVVGIKPIGQIDNRPLALSPVVDVQARLVRHYPCFS